ncbi:hypothetical protein FACS189462_4630 [Spirochaetia bacterium]|nr:hypothetical protein FACS189462_4630 [Spirochaetia bacterium]
MKDEDFAQLCLLKDEGLRLAVTRDGALYRDSGSGWAEFDFNGMYGGYYAPCCFTAVASAGGVLYAAGLDSQGLPQVFCSLQGSVWEGRDLTMRYPGIPERRARGRVLRILYEETQRQVFLVCDNGELITLPDCPECVRVQRIIDEPVADGGLEEGNIVFSLAGGGQKRFPVGAAAQRRVSLDFTRRKLAEGGVLVDLRPEAVHKTEGSREQDLIGKSISLSIEDLDTWLGTQNRERVVIFVCRSGVQADIAARRALNLGFVYAYSLGGAAAFFHI